MKKYVKSVILALCFVLCVGVFVACTNDGDSKVKTIQVALPTDKPTGVEEISSNPQAQGNTITLSEGETCTIVVTLAYGYDKGSLKVYNDYDELQGSSSSDANGRVVLSYGFKPTANSTIKFAGMTSVKTFKVNMKYVETNSTAKHIYPSSVDLDAQTATGSQSQGGIYEIQKVADIFNRLEGESEYAYGNTITLTAEISGEDIAFPRFVEVVDGEATVEYAMSYSATEKTSIVKAVITLQKATTISLIEENFSEYESTSITQNWGRENLIKGEFIDENGNKLSTATALYGANEIYYSLDKQSVELNSNEALAAAFTEGFKALAINGKETEAETKTINGSLYLKLDKPNAYNENSADGYYFGTEKLVKFLESSDKFVKTMPTFTCTVSLWGIIPDVAKVSTFYEYRYVNGTLEYALCLGEKTTSITVVLNGKTEIVFDDVQNAKETTKESASLCRYYDGSTYFNGEVKTDSVSGKTQTHKLVLDAKEYGKITSVEVKSSKN